MGIAKAHTGHREFGKSHRRGLIMFEQLKKVRRTKQYDRPNPELEKAIADVRRNFPHLFWKEHELHKRRFYNQPAHPVPYAGYVSAYKPMVSGKAGPRNSKSGK
jgi:hypothetical protein